MISQPRFAGADWGIAVVSLSNGRTVYSHHADQLFQPASTAKLFTAAVTLSELGADYRIPTRVLAGGEIRNGRLDGPLILYGMGDPTLGVDVATLGWANQLAEQLAAQGLRHVHGDLIADSTYFASPAMGTGWEAIDLQSWFAVPASALSVGENQVDLTVTPGAGAGIPAQLRFDPANAIPSVANEVVTSAQRTHNDVNLYRAPGDGVLYAFGNIAAKSPAQNYKLALPDPAQFAGQLLKEALLRRGIQLDGKLLTVHWPRRDTFLPAQPQTLAEVLSPPIGEILERGLKRSQNLYLQNLLLLAGVKAQADIEQREGSMGFITSERWGIRAMNQLLGQIGIAPAASLIEEGTGLSRRNLATPRAMAQLLAFLAAQPYGPALVDALADCRRRRHVAVAHAQHAGRKQCACQDRQHEFRALPGGLRHQRRRRATGVRHHAQQLRSARRRAQRHARYRPDRGAAGRIAAAAPQRPRWRLSPPTDCAGLCRSFPACRWARSASPPGHRDRPGTW